MRKTLLSLIIISISACSVDRSAIGKAPPKTFLELVPGEYTLENKKVNIGSNGDIYENTSLLYEYVKEKSNTNTQAYYSMYGGGFVGLEILQNSFGPNDIVLYKKGKTESWDTMKFVLFTIEHIIATPEELFKILIQQFDKFYEQSIAPSTDGNFTSRRTNYTYIKLKGPENPMQAIYSVNPDKFVGIAIVDENGTDTIKMYQKDKTEPWTDKNHVTFKDSYEFEPYSWQVVGKLGISVGRVDCINLAIDDNDIPYIAYRDHANNKRAVVWTLKNNTWIPAGRSPDASDDNISDLSLAIDGDGFAHIAYNDSKSLIQFKKNSNKKWENRRAPASIHKGKYIDLAISKNNISYIFFDAESSTDVISHPNTEDNNWSKAGTMPVDSSKSNLIITINDYGIPYISFIDTEKENRTSIMKLSGNEFVYVSGTRVKNAKEIVHSLVFDNNNNLYIADQGDSKNTVRKFNGITWSSVGTLDFNSQVSLDIDNNNTPYIAYIKKDNTIGVQKFNGTAWVEVGFPTIRSTGKVDSVKLVIDSKGVPYVAYRDYSNGQKITVMKYTKTP